MRAFIHTILVSLLLFPLFVGLAPGLGNPDKPNALLFRFPDVSKTDIVFVYAGDLWTASKTGGTARRLSSPPGHEYFPKYSPDGSQIAFSGNYDGNTDVYIMPAEGGEPRRLTHHPMPDWVVEWYPEGDAVLVKSQMMSPRNRFHRLFRQPVAGGLPQPLPMPYGELASFSPDGTRMVFQLISREFRTWKRYRGGMASDLWLYDFVNETSEKITDFEGTDALPMWHENRLYFLSDRDEKKKLNIWAMDLNTREVHAVTHFAEYDVKWPSIGPENIVLENGGNLYLVNLADETVHPVDIRVPADLPEVRPQWKDLRKYIQNYDLSPNGKRGVFEARGELLTVPAKEGSVRNLSHSSGTAERYPKWSPDGQSIAYFSDKTGEYELYIRASDGKGEPRRITHDGAAFRYEPRWSPDSKKIAFSDKTGRLYIVDVSQGQPKQVDKDEWFEIHDYSWSPDSRWLAYRKNNDNLIGTLWVYNSQTDKAYRLTHGYYDDSHPVFDTQGKYLFFYSNRIFRPLYGDMDVTWVYPASTGIYVATLKKDEPSPMAPRSDEEPPPDKKVEEKPEAKKALPIVNIDIEGFENRVVPLPVKPGNVGRLSTVEGKVLYLEFPLRPSGENGSVKGTLKYFDLKERKEEIILDGIQDYVVARDGKHLLYRSEDTFGIIEIAAGKKVGDGVLKLDGLKAWIHPREEWKQIFTETWRIERDYFYDPGMHGVNWKAIYARYGVMLPYVVDRTDLNYLIGEMIAELNASHTYVGGGDVEQEKNIKVGLLGCDFEFDEEHGLFKFGKIYEGAPWDADDRSPLREPGVNVHEGEYLLAVNGVRPDPKEDPWAAFQGLADEIVTLTVNTQPTFVGSRDVLVKPMADEQRLRYLAWVEENRKKVETKTNGRVGYIYVPNTGIEGQTELLRQFIPQRDKEALIIDERFNSGGQIPDRFIELLNRPLYNYWARRDFKSWQTPFISHTGPKVMLINGWSGSGGDAFPYYFRKEKLGPLVGTRTWGGLIGISGNPHLIDGGYVTAPTFGFWNTRGEWEVEGFGVEPDVRVENPPHLLTKGKDLQLEKAIEIVLATLETNPPSKPRKPAYPNKSQ